MNLWLNTACFAQGTQAVDKYIFYSSASPCPSTSGSKTISGNFRPSTNQSCKQLFLPSETHRQLALQEGAQQHTLLSLSYGHQSRQRPDLSCSLRVSGAAKFPVKVLCGGGCSRWYFPGMQEAWLTHEEYWWLVALTLVRVNPAGMKRFRFQYLLEEKGREEEQPPTNIKTWPVALPSATALLAFGIILWKYLFRVEDEIKGNISVAMTLAPLHSAPSPPPVLRVSRLLLYSSALCHPRFVTSHHQQH